jgi:hypothetical protein
MSLDYGHTLSISKIERVCEYFCALILRSRVEQLRRLHSVASQIALKKITDVRWSENIETVTALEGMTCGITNDHEKGNRR